MGSANVPGRRRCCRGRERRLRKFCDMPHHQCLPRVLARCKAAFFQSALHPLVKGTLKERRFAASQDTRQTLVMRLSQNFRRRRFSTTGNSEAGQAQIAERIAA